MLGVGASVAGLGLVEGPRLVAGIRGGRLARFLPMSEAGALVAQLRLVGGPRLAAGRWAERDPKPALSQLNWMGRAALPLADAKWGPGSLASPPKLGWKRTKTQ